MSLALRPVFQAVPFLLLLAGAPHLAGSPARAASEALERAPRRILLHLPEGARPDPLLPYAALAPGLWRPSGRPARLGARPGERESAERLLAEQLLAERGAVAFARLADGVAVAPDEWDDVFVVEFDPPLSRAEAESLVTSLRRAAPRLEAQVDAVYEILAAPGFDWGAGAALAPAGARLADPAAAQGAFPDDPQFVDGTQWGLANDGTGPWSRVPGLDVRALDAWALATGNTSLLVGVVDTGIDPGHPDLVRPLADGQSRLFHRSTVRPDGSAGVDSVGHGTQVWGVLAALTHNGASLGGLGMAGLVGGAGGDSAGARLISIKVTLGRSTTAQASDMSRAIVDAYALGARVINLSFAGNEPSDLVRSTLAFVAERGTIVVCGAGNQPGDALQYPGSYSRFGVTLSVGALAPDGSLAVFSTYGDQVDVVAPGENIFSTFLTYQNAFGSPLRDYAVNAGTSFAAPLVTGSLGLAAARGTDLVASDYQEVVRRTARDWGPPGRDSTFGSGLLDAGELLRRLAPPYGFRRGVAPARSWAYVGSESLSIRFSGLTRGGRSVDGDYWAEAWEVRAPVGPLGGFLEAPAAWVRYTGAGGWSRGRVHEYNYSWGAPVAGSVTETGFELSSFVYFIATPPPGCAACPPVGWVPRPPDEVRLHWTAWARLDGPPTLTVLEPAVQDSWAVGGTRTVRWSASDPDQVSHVEVWWESGWMSALLATAAPPGDQVQIQVPCHDGSGTATLRVVAVDARGPWTDRSEVGVPLAVTGESCLPATALLTGPMPNPARGAARFDVQLSAAATGDGVLRILDTRGREMVRLPAPGGGGPSVVSWDGRGRDGTLSPSGVYFAVLEDGVSRGMQRFVWLR